MLGKKKRIISFCLWGDRDVYNVGAVANAAAALEVYSGWICRFYVLNGAPAIPRLREFPNTEVVSMVDEPGYGKMLWRLLAASDYGVDRVIFRDCDSRLEWKERGAVDEWIASKASAHLMRDVDGHMNELILGGMWGIRGGVIMDMRALVRAWISSQDMTYHPTDQLFLRYSVWPRIEKSVLCHGLPSNKGGPDPRPFPKAPQERSEYVAMSITPDDRDMELCKRNAPFRRRA